MIPGIGPEWKSSIVEDVGGTSAKFGVYTAFKAVSTSANWASTPFGAMSGAVAETLELGGLVFGTAVAPAAAAAQLTVHAGCAISAAF
jgi:hypothetical protein